jgi:hypothetical protein
LFSALRGGKQPTRDKIREMYKPSISIARTFDLATAGSQRPATEASS